MLLKQGDRTVLGSKAFDLYRCRLLGAPVPDFVVVPTGYHGMRDRGRAVVSLRGELSEALAELGGVVAVRSSSVAEDRDSRSHAGRFKTVLRVDSAQALEDALVEVWRSSDDQPMAVMIQRMLEPRISGVLFTRDPVRGANRTVIEYVEGLGEALVSGKRNPERLEFPNDVNVGTDARFGDLVRLARTLEEGLGHPLDIEWAECEAAFKILQARPITNLSPPDRRTGPSYSRVQAEEFYSGPVSPLFYSMFDTLLTEYYLGDTLETLRIQIPMDCPALIRHKNHLYVSTSLMKHALSRIPSRLVRRRLLEVLPPDERSELASSRCIANPGTLVRILIFVLLHPKYWITNLDRYFMRRVVPELIRRLNSIGDFPGMDRKELLVAYDQLLEITRLHIQASKWGLALYSVPLIGAMEHFLERNGIGNENLLSLVTGLEEDMTLEASEELRRLSIMILHDPEARRVVETEPGGYPAYQMAFAQVPNGDLVMAHFESILYRHGHRRLTRDLISPAWSDDPMIPFSIVRRLVMEGGNGHIPTQHQLVGRRIAAEEEIRRRLPIGRRWLFRLLARYLVRYTAFRELQRFYLDLILAKVRALFLEISRRMVDDGEIRAIDDIFFLEVGEVRDYLMGKTVREMQGMSMVRRLSYADHAGTPGRYCRLGVDFDTIGQPDEVSAHGRPIKGQSVSSGAYIGEVRVIPDIASDSEISGGDVIVTRCLDPGQTHFLMLAGALVMEVGGILSHGAILARELGIPTVAQVKDATSILRTGQQVLVDGTKGEIIIID